MNQRGATGIWIIVVLALIAIGGLWYSQNGAGNMGAGAAAESIVGTWQATDDENVIVRYEDDGSVVDYYAGELMSSNTWSLGGDAQETLTVFDGTEAFIYTIIQVDKEQLVLNYMPRGNTLAYKRLTDEEVFNLSGRVKAIEKGSDLWQVYSDDVSGVTFNYPHNVTLTDSPMRDGGKLRMTVEVTDVDTITEGTLGFDRESVLANKAALESGEYGNGVDSPIQASEKLRKIGDISAQDLIVFGRFEVCNVTFERKLYFFNNNHSVLITLYGPQEDIMQESASYFTVNPENCGEEIIWDFDNQAQTSFYNALAAGTAGPIAQEWYDAFDDIVDTIELR